MHIHSNIRIVESTYDLTHTFLKESNWKAIRKQQDQSKKITGKNTNRIFIARKRKKTFYLMGVQSSSISNYYVHSNLFSETIGFWDGWQLQGGIHRTVMTANAKRLKKQTAYCAINHSSFKKWRRIWANFDALPQPSEKANISKNLVDFSFFFLLSSPPATEMVLLH